MHPNSVTRQIDRIHLTNLVQKSLGRSGLQLTDWKTQPLHGGMEWDSAVFRLQGEVVDAGETVPWSLILKAVKPAGAKADPGGIWYWKREALAYRSGMLGRLPGGNVAAPTCHQVQERPDGSIWLWLEDVQEDIDSPWSVEHYAVAARHLGQFNGAYLSGQALPSEPWITRSWLRKYVGNAAPMVAFIRDNPNHPMIRKLYPGVALAQILATWDEHEAILDVLDRLPQVFCHQDAFRGNLFLRQGKTLLIDWGYSGTAPVGTELVALVLGSVGMYQLPAGQVEELDRRCFESYVQGLRDAGWSGDARLVRMGYAITSLLRYPIGGSVGEALPRLLDQESRSHMETTFDRSADEMEKSDPALVAYYQKLLPEALKLLGLKRLGSLLGRFAAHTVRTAVRRGR